MKKPKKKLVIGVGAVAVVAAGAIAVLGNPGKEGETLPKVEVVEAVTGDVQQTVEASGTVVSEEEKTYFSPANAKVDEVSFKEGETVKAGTKLVEFNMKDLEREEKKAELNVKSGKLDMQNTLNKSDKAVKKQKDAQGNVASLEQQVAAQKNYVASLKSQLAQVTADAQAQAAAEAARKAEEARKAQEKKQQEIQRQYEEAVRIYESETLPAYQNRLNELNSAANQALTVYNQAENTYQMAFTAWSADQSPENTEALSQAEADRSNAQVEYQNAQAIYEDYKTQMPPAPLLSDFTGASDLVTDGSGSDFSDTPSGDISGGSVSVDTSGIEIALEQASSDLAELQSELASQEAIAEADPNAVTKEEKEKMKITNNLSELEKMSAKELVESAKNGVTADFNGVISKVTVVEGSTVTQGTELFTLQNTDKVDVDVNISKYDYDKIQENQKAEITLAGKKYEGTVTSVSHIATQNEKGASLISARVRIDHPDENVFLGVDAKVTIQADKAEDVLVLPAEVVNIGKQGSFCYVLEDGVIAKKNIETGLSSDDYIEVTEGIEEGDTVIRDIGTLQEGMPAEAMASGDAAVTGEGA